jgi:leader peptidase (prepilin peptidase)/N-methyltransferase
MASLSESAGPRTVPQPKPSRDLPGATYPQSTPPARRGYRQLALHPLVLAASATLVFADLFRFGLGARGVAGLILLPVLVVLSAIDIRHRVLPNRIVLPATGLVLATQIALASDHGAEAAVAAIAAGAAFHVLRAVYPQGLGMGDVKLALLLGAALGKSVLFGVFIGSVCVAAAGLIVLAREGAEGRKTTLPFGPFLAAGAVVAFFLG